MTSFRQALNIDTLVPAIQTGALLAVNYVLGKLNQFSVSVQSASIIGGVTALVAAVAQNFFKNPVLRYLSIPASTLAGYLAHRFIYPTAAIDPRILVLTTVVLFIVRVVADNLPTVEEIRANRNNARSQVNG